MDADDSAGRRQPDRGGATYTALGTRYLAGVSVASGLLRGAVAALAALVITGVVLGLELLTAVGDAAPAGGDPLGARLDLLSLGVTSGADLAGSLPEVVGKLVGWVFLAAHQVPIVVRGAGAGEGATDLLAAMNALPDAPLTPLVYHAIPPLVLVLVGARVAVAAGALTPGTGLLPGASVALGYVPLAVVASHLAALDGAPSGPTLGPDPATAVVFVGVYAVAFGALGGLLAGALNDAELSRSVRP